MARVLIPVVALDRAMATNKKVGASGTEVAGHATDFNYFVAGDKTFLIARNNGVVQRTFTVLVAKTVDSNTITASTKTLEATTTAGDSCIVGPFPSDIYTQADGWVYINPSHADVKFQAFTL